MDCYRFCFTARLRTDGDGASSKVLTLEEAVDFALKNYPAVRFFGAGQRCAGGVGLARTSYLPRADMLWQTNRATTTTSRITATAVGDRSDYRRRDLSPSNQSAWGSAAGFYSPGAFRFWIRGAKVDAARAVRNRASAESSLTRLDVAVATVNAYLTVMAAEQIVQAPVRMWSGARRSTKRFECWSIINCVRERTLPAPAQNWPVPSHVARAQQQEQISKAALADILGIADTSVEVSAGSVLDRRRCVYPRTALTAHPAAQVEQARVAKRMPRFMP